MKLGVLNVLLGNMNLDEACKFLSEQGVTAIELGAGGYTSDVHCKPEELLNDEAKYEEFIATLKKYHMEVSALSPHGNPVHPDKAVAAQFDKAFRNAVLLAEKMGVSRVVTFSGCPGGSKYDKTPNWATCAWPADYQEILKYQWDEVLIPYWQEAAAFCREHHVDKICFEMHPGFCVYNPETLLRLRDAVGPEIGANFDPSHLIWQGIDPVAAIRELKDCMFHFHAKDTRIDKYNAAKNGVLDTKTFDRLAERGWAFRTVGYGTSLEQWKEIVSALRTIGYDFVMSIEHEDALMSPTEGLKKAIALLKQAMTFEGTGDIWWA